jgi:hypothetical protein
LVYLVSEKTSDETFVQYLSEETKDALNKQAEDNDDWLYSDEADSSDYLSFNTRARNM